MDLYHHHVIQGVVLTLEQKQTSKGTMMLKIQMGSHEDARKLTSRLFVTIFEDCPGFGEARKGGRGSVWKVDYDVKRAKNPRTGEWGEYPTAREVTVVGHDMSLCNLFAAGAQRTRSVSEPKPEPDWADVPKQTALDDMDDVPF